MLRLVHKRINSRLIGRNVMSKRFNSSSPDPVTTTSTAANGITQGQANDVDVTSNIASSASNEQVSSILSNEQIHNAFLHDMPQKVGDLASLGLSYSWPSGWITQFLEAFYITSGLPWWATILLYTLTIRILLLPSIVKMQKTNAKLMKISPKLKILQDEISASKESQDMVKLQAALSKMQDLYTNEKVSPLSALKGPVMQGAILISTFLALRKMAELPVPSFEHGGLWWFTNLSAGDPTYILPVVSTLSVLALFKYTNDMSPPNAQADTIKKVMPWIAVLGAYFVSDFPAALFVYWITSNVFSILQTYSLQTPMMRKRFGIPKIVKPPVQKASGPKELSFVEGFKIAYENAKNKNSVNSVK
eukprot:NODE_393_length_9450_cov_0.506791.p3 type:complete len:362 gc:universal NODE_393_length_9450_cov_0.506791:8191-9276(+)